MGNGLELPGSEINCHKCQDDGCLKGALHYPGKSVKCSLGVFTCQKFYGGNQPSPAQPSPAQPSLVRL
jgi:hypothetical protein